MWGVCVVVVKGVCKGKVGGAKVVGVWCVGQAGGRVGWWGHREGGRRKGGGRAE